ncbi:hypothetical protein ACQUY5_31460 [Bacillus cereus]|uniref:hypothetical protein n=1 Tax=Bacillus cereus TaxID=1396 RepID=UPI003D17BF9E
MKTKDVCRVKEVCSNKGCSLLLFQNGLCRKHYTETLDFSKLKGVSTPYDRLESKTIHKDRCKIGTCRSLAKHEGYCGKHATYILDGRIDELFPTKETGECKVGDCNSPTRTNDYCNKHYQQSLKYGKGLTKEEHKQIMPTLFCREEGCLNRTSIDCFCEEHATKKKVYKHKCSHKGCGAKVFENNLCSYHYMETVDLSVLKGVTTIFDKEEGRRRGNKACKIKRCQNLSTHEGYCLKHASLIVAGKLIEHITKGKSPICKVDGCGGVIRTKGYCQRHYLQSLSYGKAYTEGEFKKLRPKKYCNVDGCLHKVKRNGRCQNHL